VRRSSLSLLASQAVFQNWASRLSRSFAKLVPGGTYKPENSRTSRVLHSEQGRLAHGAPFAFWEGRVPSRGVIVPI
jgi:hypothetical protein